MTNAWLFVGILASGLATVTLSALLPSSVRWRVAVFALVATAASGLYLEWTVWRIMDSMSRWVLLAALSGVAVQTCLLPFEATVRAGRWTGRLWVALSTASGSSLGTVGGIFAGACFNFLVLYLVPTSDPLSDVVEYSFAILVVGAIVSALAYFRVLGRISFVLLRWSIRAKGDHIVADYAIATGPKGIQAFLTKPQYAAWNSDFMQERLGATSYRALSP